MLSTKIDNSHTMQFTYISYQERLRDWPFDVAATFSQEQGAKSSGIERFRKIRKSDLTKNPLPHPGRGFLL
jgi:hypothetical protein